ncbi:MAG: fibrobacter succinogenes major paralogous domain-containing protein [Bacteroidales bacterium]|nr:fibrobacter succinogenes major paralogous domain-containing protein [Bacteroidales bacterium]
MNHRFIYILLGISILFSSCKKKDEAIAPTVTTTDVTEITQNTVKSGGTITSNGGAEIKSYGVCWSTNHNPTIDDNKTSQYTDLFIVTATGLTANTTYYLRAYATNSVGTGYGNEVSFTTLAAVLPVVKSVYPASITQTTAQCGGEVTSDGGAPITRGVCWNTSENPTTANSKTTDGTGVGVFTSSLIGLTASTTYYVRAYATNIAGTAYSDVMMVRTMQGTVTDIDGNVYKTVIIGTQEWMAENLKVTHYRNGDPITNITDNTQWINNRTQGAWCSYNNDAANKNIYGLLYNYYTIADSRGICPIGWHVPSDAEWNILISYLGGVNIAGYKMKKAGDRIDADNSSGFTALLGGARDYDFGTFYALKSLAQWWSSTGDQYNAWSRYINSTEKSVHRDGPLNYAGISIRCIKDN